MLDSDQNEVLPASGPVTLMVDYSNGVLKIITNLPYRPAPGAQKLGVTDLLDLAQSMPPGLAYEYEPQGFDRGGREMGVIRSVDQVKAEGPGQQWAVWINQTPASGLRRVTEGSLTKFGYPTLEPGDILTLKLVASHAETV